MNKERVKRILDVFDEMYPDAKCELVHHNELELLIAVMLSAQTTDASVNKLTEQLFQKYQSVEDYAKAPLSQLENDLRTIGLYRNKAKNVKAMAQKLIDDFDGQVPCDHEALQTLPGVGRKTANVVISEGFKVPAIAVVVEQKLQKAIPQERWIKTHHQMIFFGRYHCKSINPDCQHCSLIDICKEPKRKKYLNIEKD